jgi:hypothetical protein
MVEQEKMVYSSDVFVHLINKFSTWSSLFSFLLSPEGGSLRVIHKEGDRYAILRYVKGQSDMAATDKPWVRWMRSVVWDTETNRPVCVAPPKAHNTEIPSSSNLVVEEFVEGVMVNGFVTESPDMNWATRSSLGAATGFYGTKTFAEMIGEAEKARGWGKGDLAGTLRSANQTFASFVLQHPEHRVVQKIDRPSLYMIHCGSVAADGTVTIQDSPAEWHTAFHEWAVKTYPPLAPGETAATRLDSMIRTADASWQGFVFRGSNGDRWRLRSLGYKILRELRGKESRVEERFTRLRAQNMVRLYTQNWTEEQQAFFELEKRLRGLTSKVYTEYCAVHKEKSKVFLDVPIPLRTPVYQLHGIYLNSLRPKNLTLKMPVVIQYMNNLPTEGQAALLRSSVEVDLTQGDAC